MILIYIYNINLNYSNHEEETQNTKYRLFTIKMVRFDYIKTLLNRSVDILIKYPHSRRSRHTSLDYFSPIRHHSPTSIILSMPLSIRYWTIPTAAKLCWHWYLTSSLPGRPNPGSLGELCGKCFSECYSLLNWMENCRLEAAQGAI